MPRTRKLTWQPGAGGRGGRWKKQYKGKVYYFDGGRGKSDQDAYETALTTWEEKKVQIDVAAPKPHQEAYERAIAEWETALAWCRKHHEEQVADVAMAKLAELRQRLDKAKPRLIGPEDTFDGQFDRSVRYPGLDEMLDQLSESMNRQNSDAFHDLPGYAEYREAARVFFDGLLGDGETSTSRTVIVPSNDGWDTADPLHVERAVWRDRLDVMQRTASAPSDESVKSYVECFLADKQATVATGEVTAGRVYALRLHLSHFSVWLGEAQNVIEIDGKTLNDYRLELLKQVESDKWSAKTAKDRLGSVKAFVRWLWHIEAIPSLPRIMDGSSQALKITHVPSEIVVFTKDEVATLLKAASSRVKLYLLLMLNCGMTQKDIADLQIEEVDWKNATITRKRSKTRNHANVPEVTYALWPETAALLTEHRNSDESGCVLLNSKGRPLWSQSVDSDGKLKKADNIKNAYDRLRQRTEITKPMKSLKKTSATLIRGNEKYASLERIFLGHAPTTMSDRHYTKAPQELFEEAVTWLRKELEIG